MGKEFGIWLTQLRVKRGFESQRQLASCVDISNSTLARIENGTSEPELETLKKLACCLRVDYEEMMEKAGYIKPKLKKTRGETKKLIKVIGQLQNMIGEAKNLHFNDRSQTAFGKAQDILEVAFNLCVETRSSYESED